VDILITGCEVSLWLGEQFASDLSALMPKLNIKTTAGELTQNAIHAQMLAKAPKIPPKCPKLRAQMLAKVPKMPRKVPKVPPKLCSACPYSASSNKLLGLFGQEFAIPQTGHQLTENTWDLDGTVVIIVSHSGGTFAPLASSNLMQAKTNNIFVVASEWDTQVGKQLRKMPAGNGGIFDSRVFSTNVGVRPAEPCTVSVAATHQVLTLILEYICQTVLAAPDLRAVAGRVDVYHFSLTSFCSPRYKPDNSRHTN
jgi:hypothetical protein